MAKPKYPVFTKPDKPDEFVYTMNPSGQRKRACEFTSAELYKSIKILESDMLSKFAMDNNLCLCNDYLIFNSPGFYAFLVSYDGEHYKKLREEALRRDWDYVAPWEDGYNSPPRNNQASQIISTVTTRRKLLT